MRDIDLIRSYREHVGDDDEAARAAARDRLRAHIAAADAGANRRARRLRRRTGVSLAVLLVVCSSAAAAGLLLKSDDLHLGSVACLDTARTIDAGTGKAVFAEPTGDPVAACAPLWRAGHLDGRRHATAPDLVACAAAGRPVVVIPGDPQTCRELDLEPLPRDFAAAASATGRAKAVLQRDADLHRPLSRCDDPDEVLARSRTLLAGAGVGDFPVELAGAGPCAGVYLFDGGAVARIELLSRRDAGDYYEHRLIGAALEPLDERAPSACEDPRRAAARARQLLRAAGLPQVAVRVEQGGGRCFDPGGYIVGHHEIVLSTAARAVPDDGIGTRHSALRSRATTAAASASVRSPKKLRAISPPSRSTSAAASRPLGVMSTRLVRLSASSLRLPT